MEATEIARLLPAIYQDRVEGGSVLHVILAVMEEMHRPDEAVISHFEDYLDPRRAPDPFVDMLGRLACARSLS